jgi:5-methylcytosine-specific restriction endonuclease McrA
MKRSTLQRAAALPRSSKLKRARLHPIGKRGQEIRSELATVRTIVLHRDGHVCQRCRKRSCVPLDLHHKRARSQGGTHTLDNLITLGRACHDAVTDHTAPDWRRWIWTRKGSAA